MSNTAAKPGFSFSAPGTIMITGEHSVVYGHSAIVCAIEQRIRISITTRDDRLIEIQSAIAPTTTLSLDTLEPNEALRFVIACIALYQDKLTHGFNVRIDSEINPNLGLGSSAAVTIAMLGCMRHLTGEPTEDVSVCETIHAQALKIIQTIQGRGSGADLAACIRGGLIAYYPPQQEGLAKIKPLATPPPIHLAYSGYKTPTAEVLAKIAQDMQGKESYYEALYSSMGKSTERAIQAATAENWTELASELNQYQTFMQQLGVSDEVLNALIAKGNTITGCLAAKISGSGLGDCVLTLGALDSNSIPKKFTAVTVANTGLQLHKF